MEQASFPKTHSFSKSLERDLLKVLICEWHPYVWIFIGKNNRSMKSAIAKLNAFTKVELSYFHIATVKN